MRKNFTKKMVTFSLAATVIATSVTPVSASAQKLAPSTDYSNPKNWNVRHTVNDIYDMLTALEKAYPEYAELVLSEKRQKKMILNFLQSPTRIQKITTKKVLRTWQISTVMKGNQQKVLLIQQHGC